MEKRGRILRAMGTAIGHRGPDDEQFYDDAVLSMVYRRLAIVDVAGGRQPLFNEDASLLLVCNGEIYNHKELRDSLKARHAFKTASDAEVLLHGYEEWGDGVLQRARGMFAMAIWDCRQQRLLLARDRLGIKPLYVCHLANGLLFGSELKALLAHPKCPRDMDGRDLSGNPIAQPLTHTFVKGIDFLPGGSYLVAQGGRKPQIYSYWSLGPHFNTAPFGRDAKRYVSAFDELLEAAVAEHLQGESAVGLHLSGGVDSSLVAAVAAPHCPGLPSYTIVERSNFLAGDVTAAADVATTLGLDWSPVLFDYRSVLADSGFSLATLEQASWMMDSPLFDIEWIFKRALNQVIRTRHPALKVLLLGQGADEFSGGYSSRIDAPFKCWNDYLRDEVQHHLSVGASAEPLREGRHSVFLGKRRNPPGISPYQQMMLLMPRQLQAHNLWHEDRTSACFGMEARVPFLDHRIVEFFASVPAELHKKLFWNKAIIRQALRKRLPKYDLTRLKIGFCWTDDSRSLDIIIQSMASQASDAFREKYVKDKDYPFDRTEAERLIHRVQTRQPGFKAASVELLGLMSASIFSRNLRQPAHAQATAATTGPALVLEIVGGARWPDLIQHFSRQPVVPFDWHAEHCPAIPAGCRLQRVDVAAGPGSYRLMEGDTVHAEVVLPVDMPWVRALMAGLDDPSGDDFSVQDWMQLLDVSRAQMTEVLDTLLQCGMVTTPQRRQTGSYWKHIRHYLRKRLFHALQLPEARPAAPAARWMTQLQQRKQVLVEELRR